MSMQAENSVNSDLAEENIKLKQSVAEMQQKITEMLSKKNSENDKL